MAIKKVRYIKAAKKMPTWAFLERSLIKLMNESVDLVLEKYLRPDGEFLWPPDDTLVSYDSLDDAYESFHSWPLFYLLGGDARFLALAQRQFDVITAQFARYDCGSGHPMVVKEYEQSYDWMHQGEGYLLFYFLNLADPKNALNKERSLRFAGFYLNEDKTIPEYNYDAEHNVLKSAYLGSMGPGYHNFSGDWHYEEYMDNYGLPFYDVPGVLTVLDLQDPVKAKRMGDVRRERLQKSDTVINLIATSLVMNAYLHTGAEKYKDWIIKYIHGWRERSKGLPGPMPDNCGPTGKVGELIDGKWYGGHYGWTFPHGFHFIADALTIAGENECLLTGDTGKLLWVRQETEKLLEQAIEDDGLVLVPQKYADEDAVIEYSSTNDRIMIRPDKVTDRADFSRKQQVNGWYEFLPLAASHLTHVYLTAFDQKAHAILLKTMDNKSKSRPEIIPEYSKYQGGQDRAYISYLAGGYPAYPVDVLEHSLKQVYGRLKLMHEDQQDPASYDDAYLQRRNPITTEALIHLTMGGPMPIYNGGLLQVSVIYYDSKKQRPGLPEDVAALVNRCGKDFIELTLANLHPTKERSLFLQAGAFNEHSFTELRSDDDAIPEPIEINNNWLEIELGPGSLFNLSLGLERFVNPPSYARPF